MNEKSIFTCNQRTGRNNRLARSKTSTIRFKDKSWTIEKISSGMIASRLLFKDTFWIDISSNGRKAIITRLPLHTTYTVQTKWYFSTQLNQLTLGFDGNHLMAVTLGNFNIFLYLEIPQTILQTLYSSWNRQILCSVLWMGMMIDGLMAKILNMNMLTSPKQRYGVKLYS